MTLAEVLSRLTRLLDALADGDQELAFAISEELELDVAACIESTRRRTR